jgi:hypothetical protein
MIGRELAGLVDAWATPERAVVLGVAGLWQWPPRTGKQDVKLATKPCTICCWAWSGHG